MRAPQRRRGARLCTWRARRASQAGDPGAEGVSARAPPCPPSLARVSGERLRRQAPREPAARSRPPGGALCGRGGSESHLLAAEGRGRRRRRRAGGGGGGGGAERGGASPELPPAPTSGGSAVLHRPAPVPRPRGHTAPPRLHRPMISGCSLVRLLGYRKGGDGESRVLPRKGRAHRGDTATREGGHISISTRTPSCLRHPHRS